MTRLCVPIFVHSLEQARRDMAAAVEAGADIVELRIDTLPEPAAIEQILPSSMIPVIVTCRSKSEGGFSELGDDARLAAVELAASCGANYIDLELASVADRSAKLQESFGSAARIIISSHDFIGRPERLYNLLVEMDKGDGDIAKIAWTARTVRDNLEAFEILQKAGKPTIALCMGEAGIISRILAKKFGAFLTFASLDEKSATAPGQISIATMKSLYRWDKITPAIKVYGVVAHPVAHSMSPAVHNAAFDATGHDGIYGPFLVNPGYESFKAFMESFVYFEGLDLHGLSITLPHKENALRYLKEKAAEIEPMALRIGAVNTIKIERSGPAPILSGRNTDYAAISHTICLALNCDERDLKGKRVAVLGAGGTGRTAVAEMTRLGAKVTMFNRTLAKAQSLATEFGATAEPMENLAGGQFDIYINTTSLGMHPNIAQSPFAARPPALSKNQLVFDTIYNPLKTLFLRQAEASGAKTIGGAEMFARQARAQFEWWTKQPISLESIKTTIEARLAHPLS